MISNAAWLAMLAVFSGLAMNIILQCGLDLKGVAFNKIISKEGVLASSGLFFVTVIILWLFFTFVRSFLFLGFLEYILIFPVSALFFSVFEYLLQYVLSRIMDEQKIKSLSGMFTISTPAGGISVAAALFICMNTANRFLEIVILALGFAVGIALAVVLVNEIRRRSEMEAVPRWLRGGPLVLISLGLLSLIFSSGAVMLFTVLGAQ